MLTQTLRSLERDGLLRRTVRGGSPIQVEYEATALGRTLSQAADPIRRWAESHMEAILEAHDHFDARQS